MMIENYDSIEVYMKNKNEKFYVINTFRYINLILLDKTFLDIIFKIKVEALIKEFVHDTTYLLFQSIMHLKNYSS